MRWQLPIGTPYRRLRVGLRTFRKVLEVGTLVMVGVKYKNESRLAL
jgi:hypothetical protein